jgi:hypothetical protein
MLKKDEVFVEYQNNKFGKKWRNCWAGEISVDVIDSEVKLLIRYKDEVIIIDCYKHPFHLGAGVLKGSDELISKNISIIKEFQSRGLRAGRNYLITAKGVYEVNYNNPRNKKPWELD